MAHVTGIKEVMQLGRQLARNADAEQAQADAMHRAVVAEFKRKKQQIPKDKGPYGDSLTKPKDRAHIYEIHPRADGVEINVGSSLTYAEYQAKNTPMPEADPVAEAVAGVLLRRIE